jgi:hypothetical protein
MRFTDIFIQRPVLATVVSLLILLIGTAIAGDFKLDNAFWAKMGTLAQRKSRIVDGRIRVSEFRNE